MVNFMFPSGQKNSNMVLKAIEDIIELEAGFLHSPL